MITGIKFDGRWGWFEFITDDWCTHGVNELKIKSTFMERKWDRKNRRSITVPVVVDTPYWEWETETAFAFRYTQFPILLNHYVKLGLLTVEQYNEYIKELDMPNLPELPRTLGPMTMRDDQMEVLNKLMTKRFGLCHVCTGFGKTEMIAYMCYYYTKILGWKVLVTSPNAKVLDEIILRVNERLGTQIGVNYPNDSMILAVNAASVVKQKYNHHDYKDYLSDIKVILSDEVEACLTRTHHEIYDYCKNRECMYGFSATPDCYCGKLDIHNGVTEASFRSKHLLDTFGGSLVNITPSGFDVNIITVNLDWWKNTNEHIDKVYADFIASEGDVSVVPTNFRTEVDNDLFMQPQFATLLGKLSEKYNNLVITINRTEVIDYWVGQLPDYKIIEVSGRGYRYRYKGEIRNITKEDLKAFYLTADLILGSRSLMRGVDLPDLTNSVQLSGKKAGTTIQSIGRTARKKHMNVLILVPKKFIFGYSNQNKARISLITTQYPVELNNIQYLTDDRFKESV